MLLVRGDVAIMAGGSAPSHGASERANRNRQVLRFGVGVSLKMLAQRDEAKAQRDRPPAGNGMSYVPRKR